MGHGPGFNHDLHEQLERTRQLGLFRQLRTLNSPQSSQIQVGQQSLRNFSSNDYLGLANHPALKEAAVRAVREFGAGAGASRLVCGSLVPHRELEEALAHFKKTEAALTFASGYAAATGTLPALLHRGDIVILDKKIHASLIDGARLSGAAIRVFPHNDLDKLESILRWANQKRTPALSPRILIITESVFSMDGDRAPLEQIVQLKERYGAWLMVDEAHATGLYGPTGSGLVAEAGLSNQIEIQLGTLGKAIGAAGGYICGPRLLIDFLINHARSFIFSTAPVPAAAAAAAEGVRQVQVAEDSRRILRRRAEQFRTASGLANAFSESAIHPLVVGPESKASQLSAQLSEAGFLIPAIRFPTVPRNQARLRITLTATHTAEDVERLGAALKEFAFT